MQDMQLLIYYTADMTSSHPALCTEGYLSQIILTPFPTHVRRKISAGFDGGLSSFRKLVHMILQSVKSCKDLVL